LGDDCVTESYKQESVEELFAVRLRHEFFGRFSLGRVATGRLEHRNGKFPREVVRRKLGSVLSERS